MPERAPASCASSASSSARDLPWRSWMSSFSRFTFVVCSSKASACKGNFLCQVSWPSLVKKRVTTVALYASALSVSFLTGLMLNIVMYVALRCFRLLTWVTSLADAGANFLASPLVE